jgi:hypothetical protein
MGVVVLACDNWPVTPVDMWTTGDIPLPRKRIISHLEAKAESKRNDEVNQVER